MKSVSIGRFSIDSNIAYVIQSVTGDSTQEILGYFHGIASYVGEDILKNSKAQYWIEKNVILFYKESAIPFRLRIHGGRPSDANRNINLSVSVDFPKKTQDHDCSELMSRIVESGLGLAEEEDMPKFAKPELKTPRCLKSVRLQQEANRNAIKGDNFTMAEKEIM